MIILFEDHPYKGEDAKNAIQGISDLEDVDRNLSISYVGYFYNSKMKDCVFVLPKVLLAEEICDDNGTKKKRDYIANVYIDSEGNEIKKIYPEDIILPADQEKNLTSEEYKKFIFEFAIWIYRTLCVYKKSNPQKNAIYYKQIPQRGNGRRHQANTFLDIILSLIKFNQDNQDYFMFTIRNLHSGMNKINWTKTISKSQAIIQNGAAIYLDPVNKKRRINFDEELFVIFFSILNNLNELYGFRSPINFQYELIKDKRFEQYKNGYGVTRLRQIRYKYFSDKALQMWDLCFAFFDQTHKLSINTDQKEYILAKNYEIVFEAMIDELIGDKQIPKGLKDQYDGKRVDHMYAYDGLTISNDQQDEIYYIGDSKYYKSGTKLERTAITKQYTYARNVIQWNIDLFMKKDLQNLSDEEKEDAQSDRDRFGTIRLRDDRNDPLTEGYNVIPNFFLSAFVSPDRKYNEGQNIHGHKHKENGKVVIDEETGDYAPKTYISTQFDDRLFDRDTLILSHYDVNFLYVIYLYARNKESEKSAWRNKVRDIFRREIRKVLEQKYDFYALRSIGNPVAGEVFIRENFKELQGKLYRPYGDSSLYSLALEKKEGAATDKSEVYRLLNEYFLIEKVNLGFNPKTVLDEKASEFQANHPYAPIPHDWLPEYHVERYPENIFAIGLYHDQEHWDWITGKNDRGTLIYNVRLDKDREGSMPKTRLKNMKVKFVILYEEGHLHENRYHVFRVHDTAEMSEKRMREALYPANHGGPKGDYFIFRLDEEVTIGKFDIFKAVSELNKEKNFAPVYVQGHSLLKYKVL